ncbi:MAG: DUF992 domain-containing protein [Phyllobacteriaceae bacterium]|jgi:hypothetical protein|nr:DUF992 domain-containing protein [Phyllobacteriaceae bacterium]
MTFKSAAIALLAACALTLPAQANSGVKVGVLKCHIAGGVGFIIGSSKKVDCTFKRSGGGSEHYVGTIGKLGVDVGITDETVLGWVVFAPGKINRGALKGSYTGASAEATVGLGVGANVLIGGFRKGINLQPLSLQAQSGLNIAAGVASLHLGYAERSLK